MEFLNITNENEDEFAHIAKKLLNNYAIKNHESTFRFTDIEFYWNSSSHKDESTYKRKYADPKTGEWFFHYSGVDIALKNENNKGYGGILIRGIYDVKNKHCFDGPMICCMKLFSGTNAFSKSIKTRIIKKKFTPNEVQKGPRIGLGENAKESGTTMLNYRFHIEL